MFGKKPINVTGKKLKSANSLLFERQFHASRINFDSKDKSRNTRLYILYILPKFPNFLNFLIEEASCLVDVKDRDQMESS